MLQCIHGFVRLTIVVLAVFIAAAVAVSRAVPAAPRVPISVESLPTPVYRYLGRQSDSEQLFLSPGSTEVVRSQTTGLDLLGAGAFAPWRATDGSSRLVGRWLRRTSDDAEAICTDTGIGCFSYPDGKLIAHASTDWLAATPPSWRPDGSGEMLFASGSGKLYLARLTEDEVNVDLKVGGEVAWDTKRFATVPGAIQEVVWAAGLDLNNDVVLATLVGPARPGAAGAARSQIWWLRLDSSHRHIVDGDPISGAGLESPEVRHPAVARDASGKPWLAYLCRAINGPGFEIRVAGLDADPVAGGVTIRAGTDVRAAGLAARVEPLWADDTATMLAYLRPDPTDPGALPTVERVRVREAAPQAAAALPPDATADARLSGL